MKFLLEEAIFFSNPCQADNLFFQFTEVKQFFSFMGYSLIYIIKGNRSNFTLYRWREKLLLDAGYCVLSKGILYTIISTRSSLSGNKVSLPAGKQPNLLFFKGLK